MRDLIYLSVLAHHAIMGGMSQQQYEEQEEVVALIRGRVQGVGFRYFVQDVARSRALRGYTRNTEDGQVEVVAQGSRAALEYLLSQLRLGPPAARVEGVDAHWRKSATHFSGFTIRL